MRGREQTKRGIKIADPFPVERARTCSVHTQHTVLYTHLVQQLSEPVLALAVVVAGGAPEVLPVRVAVNERAVAGRLAPEERGGGEGRCQRGGNKGWRGAGGRRRGTFRRAVSSCTRKEGDEGQEGQGR